MTSLCPVSNHGRAALGVRRLALLTNNPDKADQLSALGLDVAERVPTGVHVSEANVEYLRAKVTHAGHTLPLRPR